MSNTNWVKTENGQAVRYVFMAKYAEIFIVKLEHSWNEDICFP